MPAHQIYVRPVKGSSPHQALQDLSPTHAEVATTSSQLSQALSVLGAALPGTGVQGQINKRTCCEGIC